MNFYSLWNSLSEKQRESIISCNKYRHHRRYHESHSDIFSMSLDQFKKFCAWVKTNDLDPEKEAHEEESEEEESEKEVLQKPQNKAEELDLDIKVNEWEHEQSYWYDESRDLYVVHLKSRKKPFVIPGSKWRLIKEAYSNWDGEPASVNEIARKHGLARKTVQELLRAMGTTHDSSLWADEETFEAPEGKLVEELVRRKEESVLIKAQRIEWNRVKRDAERYRSLDLFAEHMVEKFSEISSTYQVKKVKLKKPERGSYSVIIAPTDFHWGNYAPEYTKDAYNREIAKARLWKTTKDLLDRICERGQPEEVVICLGGDGLHIDNMQKNTTRGTPQDCDGTPEELAWTYVELCRDYIDLVRHYARVRLYVVPGNHDQYTSVLLRASMKGWFHGAKDVTVVEELAYRQYYVYGESLICFTHGDKGKVKDWPAIVADERAKDWGHTTYRFIFTGHLHTERELPTFGNVTVYRMPSLAGTDNWHHTHGYKSRKALIGYIVSKSHGVVGTEVSIIHKPK